MASGDRQVTEASVEIGASDLTISVEVAWSRVMRELCVLRVSLPRGATLGDALRATSWVTVTEAARDDITFAAAGLSAAIWSRPRLLTQVLADGDRVEVLRGLIVTPMEARRARYKAAGGAQALRKRGLAAQQQKR